MLAAGETRLAAELRGEPQTVATMRARLGEAVAQAMHASSAPDVDLLIRTGGEHRLSDFLLWECAYAELVFSDVLFPDMSAASLDAALAEFARRERRFGALPENAHVATTTPEEVARRAIIPLPRAATASRED